MTSPVAIHRPGGSGWDGSTPPEARRTDQRLGEAADWFEALVLLLWTVHGHYRGAELPGHLTGSIQASPPAEATQGGKLHHARLPDCPAPAYEGRPGETEPDGSLPGPPSPSPVADRALAFFAGSDAPPDLPPVTGPVPAPSPAFTPVAEGPPSVTPRPPLPDAQAVTPQPDVPQAVAMPEVPDAQVPQAPREHVPEKTPATPRVAAPDVPAAPAARLPRPTPEASPAPDRRRLHTLQASGEHAAVGDPAPSSSPIPEGTSPSVAAKGDPSVLRARAEEAWEALQARVTDFQETRQTIRVALKPRELGPVSLQVKLERGTAQALFEVVDHRAEQLLTGREGDMRQALQEWGIPLGAVDVRVGTGGHGKGQPHDLPEPPVPGDPAPPRGRSARRRGLLDCRV